MNGSIDGFPMIFENLYCLEKIEPKIKMHTYVWSIDIILQLVANLCSMRLSYQVKEIEMSITKIERNYLQDMTLADARLWFRYRCQIIENIKGNRSSQWRNKMGRRHCTSGEYETQDHLEKWTFSNKYREGLDLAIRDHKLMFWMGNTYSKRPKKQQ